MKKNILIVSPFFVPAYSYGWIVRVAYDQALWLTQHWYNVTAITTDVFDAKQRNKIRKEYINWIEVIRFKNVSNYLAKFQNLHLPIWMRRWLKKNIKNYDLVHIHDIYNLPTYRACKYARENKVIYFIQPHGTLSSISIESRKWSIKKYILSQMKTYFDKNHSPDPEININSLVWVNSKHLCGPNGPNKLDPKFLGPFKVL